VAGLATVWRRPSWVTRGGAFALLSVLAVWASVETVLWSESRALVRLAEAGRDRLTLYGQSLHDELEKSANVPLVLSGDPEVAALLAEADGRRREARAERVNRRLEGLKEQLHTSAIYILDAEGVTLAASNWAEGEGSFVGRRFDFRPYFTAAMEGRSGRYFALGTASKLPGYYLSMPVLAGGRVLGAVVGKTSMESLEAGWRGGGERVFVTDRWGIIFITNTPEWRFRALSPLEPEVLQALQDSRQYGEAPLPPLALVPGRTVTSVDGEGYVMVSRPLVDGDQWTLHVLMAVKESRAQARDLGLLASSAAGLVLLGLFFLVHRTRLRRRHTRDLERRVAERTVLLSESNRRLLDEVADRRRAEEDLRAAQDELVQAAKLAALGQMSAGMVHELNQPLAAIRTYADNGVTLLGRGRVEAARGNLLEIADLTDRMARISGQLKLFARKSTAVAEPVSLAGAVDSALALLAGRFAADAIDVQWRRPQPELMVWGEDLRLQQVIVNLLRNAADAMRGVAERRLVITAVRRGDTVLVDIADNGPGIAAEVMNQLFEPFFTTKPTGDGLGLGLSISEKIVRDFGGRLSAANRPGGGAVFTMLLRYWEMP